MSIKGLPHVTVDQVLALRKAAIELEKELAELKASLPKVRVDALSDFSNNMQELVVEAHSEGDVALRMMLEFSIKMANAYANKLEQGNE